MKNVMLEDIIRIVNNLDGIEVNTNQVDDELATLGMDSITFIQMVVSLEEFYGCEIPDSKLLLSELGTIRKIYNVILNEAR